MTTDEIMMLMRGPRLPKYDSYDRPINSPAWTLASAGQIRNGRTGSQQQLNYCRRCATGWRSTRWFMRSSSSHFTQIEALDAMLASVEI